MRLRFFHIITSFKSKNYYPHLPYKKTTKKNFLLCGSGQGSRRPGVNELMRVREEGREEEVKGGGGDLHAKASFIA